MWVIELMRMMLKQPEGVFMLCWFAVAIITIVWFFCWSFKNILWTPYFDDFGDASPLVWNEVFRYNCRNFTFVNGLMLTFWVAQPILLMVFFGK